ncbi:MAG: hypothetical protein ACO1PZ_01725 [Gammaproteobacteria bacterium]
MVSEGDDDHHLLEAKNNEREGKSVKHELPGAERSGIAKDRGKRWIWLSQQLNSMFEGFYQSHSKADLFVFIPCRCCFELFGRFPC